ncbi:hypothetical protein [Planctomyces sp. SH-PL62]|uniref:hypothetical protein n=1 Tax=Planctomyces sp. SH-PL62 TaxID=1636152 RepID=UPI00078CC1AB|nr:hypothetical protein [Planctomyces sp. SH-PL62]AMV40450.1 hypothetical protein VT85_23675 [Planctomyces sp. SH-PL62]
MNPSKRPTRGESRDADHGQNGLPLDRYGADDETSPDVGADGQAASVGLPDTAETLRPGSADPFNLASLRLSQDYASAVSVKRLITTIPVRKPSREWFVRTHPDSSYRLSTSVLDLKEDREVYLVAQGLWPELASEATFSPRLLVTAVNRQGVLFLWPIRLPGPDGKIDDWSRSALDAAEEAKSRWVRITANMSAGAYDIAVATGPATEPSWPDPTFQEIIKIAFRDKMVSDWSHPVLQRLRGEV